jgi:hypothetical protein
MLQTLEQMNCDPKAKRKKREEGGGIEKRKRNLNFLFSSTKPNK